MSSKLKSLIVFTISLLVTASCMPITSYDADNSSALFESNIRVPEATQIFKLKDNGDVRQYINAVQLGSEPIIETCDTADIPAKYVSKPQLISNTQTFPFKLKTSCSFRVTLYFGKISQDGLSLEKYYASNPVDNIIEKSKLQSTVQQGRTSLDFMPELQLTDEAKNFIEWGSIPTTPSGSSGGPINFPSEIANYSYTSSNGPTDISQIIGDKDYIITMISGKNCPACTVAYSEFEQLTFLNQPNSRCAFAVGGFGYEINEFSSYLADKNLAISPNLIVGSGDDIFEIMYKLYGATVADVSLPMFGITKRDGTPVQVFNYSGKSGNFNKGNGVISGNVNTLKSICQ